MSHSSDDDDDSPASEVVGGGADDGEVSDSSTSSEVEDFDAHPHTLGEFVDASVRGAGVDVITPPPRPDTLLVEARARAQREIKARLAAEARERAAEAKIVELRAELRQLEVEASAAQHAANEWQERARVQEAECAKQHGVTGADTPTSGAELRALELERRRGAGSAQAAADTIAMQAYALRGLRRFRAAAVAFTNAAAEALSTPGALAAAAAVGDVVASAGADSSRSGSSDADDDDDDDADGEATPLAARDAETLAALERAVTQICDDVTALRARADSDAASAARGAALESDRASASAAEVHRLTAAVEERSTLVRKWEEYAGHWEARGREAERLNVEWEAAFDALQAEYDKLRAELQKRLGAFGQATDDAGGTDGASLGKRASGGHGSNGAGSASAAHSETSPQQQQQQVVALPQPPAHGGERPRGSTGTPPPSLAY